MLECMAHYHLPGLFEFYELYKVFLPLFFEHREYFYDWCDIGSVYGAPEDCLWGGGRVGFGEDASEDVFGLMREYGISARLTFSNSLLTKEHLTDRKCNRLCKELAAFSGNGIIIYSDLLLDYIKNNYDNLYFVSSTTKVITDFNEFVTEINRDDFGYVVPDFRFNHDFNNLDRLSKEQRDKVEFLCNECCSFTCQDRKKCYESVSRLALSEDFEEHRCTSDSAASGYVFSEAMKNPAFISVEDIKNTYIPKGFSNFKIEGRSLGSALILEFILYYMTKPEYQLNVREAIYLNHSLDLF